MGGGGGLRGRGGGWGGEGLAFVTACAERSEGMHPREFQHADTFLFVSRTSMCQSRIEQV